MPNSRSARKNVRQNTSRRARNRWRFDRIREGVAEFRATVQGGDFDKAATQLRGLFKVMDQIASTNTIHKNTASRYKSRLSIVLNKAKAAKTKAA
ncbi:MAG: 30S ribosomal protein S20 [Planctomycetes bacterium]|nr:30S ribosomal protein S20 [Planctomycetota bacterium]